MLNQAMRFGAVGIEMGVAVGITYWIGSWLDRKFNTKPYLMLVMVILGIAAGFRGLIRVAREATRKPTGENDREA